MRADFTLYTPEYISGVMSLRKPQKKSLEILWNCQEMCSQEIPKILDRPESGSVVSQPS